MAALLPGAGSAVFSGSCGRQSAVRHHNNPKRSRSTVTGSQEPAVRLRVRDSSVTCQACTASSSPSDSHRNSSSQIRAGPSGNNNVNTDVNAGCEVSNRFSNDALQPQQCSDGQGSGPTAVGSEPVGTVVICGWLGSNMRYLKRYQDWWTQNGYGSRAKH